MVNEKLRLENLLITHEKVCNGGNGNRILPSQKGNNSSSSNNNNSNINHLNTHQNAALAQQQQNLLKIKKEELDEIIKQSNERKNQKLSSNQNYMDQQQQQQHQHQMSMPKLNIQSKFEAALNHSYNEKNFNLLLLPGAHQQSAHHLAAQTTAIVTPNSANHLETILNHFDLTKKVLTPTSNPPNIQQQFHQLNQQQQQQQQQSNHNQSNQYSPFQAPSQLNNSTIQRPNNLNLKTPSITTSGSSPSSFSSNQLITPSLATTVLMQNLAMNLFGCSNQNSQMMSNNANNISLLMTPTLQLNTPTLFALTPLESAFNSFNNCNTPIIQQTPLLSSIPIDQNSSSNSTSSKT